MFDGLGRADLCAPVRPICRGWARPDRWGRPGQGHRATAARRACPRQRRPPTAQRSMRLLRTRCPARRTVGRHLRHGRVAARGCRSGRPSGDRSHSGTTGHPAVSAARHPRARSGRRTRRRLPTPRRAADPVPRRDPHRRRRDGCVGPDPSPRSRPPRSPQRWSAAPRPRPGSATATAASRAAAGNARHAHPAPGDGAMARTSGPAAVRRRAPFPAGTGRAPFTTAGTPLISVTSAGSRTRSSFRTGSAAPALGDTTANGSVPTCRAATASATVRVGGFGRGAEEVASATRSPVQSSWVGAGMSSALRCRPIMSAMTARTATSTPTPTGTSTSAGRASCIGAHRTPDIATLRVRAHPERNHSSSV